MVAKMQTIEFDTDVVVIGAGPVGLSLAGDLGWRGRKCILIEKSDGAIYQPKMDLVGIRTMEFCRRWGLTKNVEASPYNRDYPQDNVYLTELNGFELGRQVMPSMNQDKPPEVSPSKRERCPQNMFDPILREFAEKQQSVDVWFNNEMTSFEETSQGVRVFIQDVVTNQKKIISAKFMVGCDGGRSKVRENLGIAMHGKGILTHTTNIIFECKNFNLLHDKLPGYRYMFVGTKGIWATIVAINGSDQWRMSIIGGVEERPNYTEEDLKRFAFKALGKKFDLNILSTLSWTRSELVAENYHKGRIFIAGDACHLTSPTGGLGMNTGIGDAVDISWKLSAVIEGWGGEKLLKSYAEERIPVAKRITQFSTGNLEIMKKVPVTEFIYEQSTSGEKARKVAGTALLEGLKREWFSMNMHLGNRYTKSSICAYTELESLNEIQAEYDDAINYQPSTRVGCRAPHAWLSDGRSTLDLFGREFVLLLSTGAASIVQKSFSLEAKKRGIPLDCFEISDASVRSIYDRSYVLVRPDGHIGWSSNELTSDVDLILSKVTGN